MTLNDLEPPKEGLLVKFLRFWLATHSLRLNCTEMAGDRPRQPAFSAINADFSSPSRKYLCSRRLAQADVKDGYPVEKWLLYRYLLV